MTQSRTDLEKTQKSIEECIEEGHELQRNLESVEAARAREEQALQDLQEGNHPDLKSLKERLESAKQIVEGIRAELASRIEHKSVALKSNIENHETEHARLCQKAVTIYGHRNGLEEQALVNQARNDKAEAIWKTYNVYKDKLLGITNFAKNRAAHVLAQLDEDGVHKLQDEVLRGMQSYHENEEDVAYHVFRPANLSKWELMKIMLFLKNICFHLAPTIGDFNPGPIDKYQTNTSKRDRDQETTSEFKHRVLGTLFRGKEKELACIFEECRKNAENSRQALIDAQAGLEPAKAPATPSTAKRPLVQINPVAARSLDVICAPSPLCPTPSKRRRIMETPDGIARSVNRASPGPFVRSQNQLFTPTGPSPSQSTLGQVSLLNLKGFEDEKCSDL